jgi:signal transduction histidine kinase
VTSSDPRALAVESIELALANLADALAELDRIPSNDRSAIGMAARAMSSYLSVTNATLGLLTGALHDHPNPEVAKWLRSLSHLSSWMDHTVGRLLVASGPLQLTLQPEYIDLSVLMRRACDYYRDSAVRRQLQLVFQSASDLPLVWADRVATAIVADNLLSNAVKFSRPGGEIIVQVIPGPGGAVCTIRDNGPGLTPLEQAQLFESSSGDPMPLRTPAPPGFGLATAKEFVDRMGGKLWSESDSSHGGRFSFRLPYHPEEATALPPRS